MHKRGNTSPRLPLARNTTLGIMYVHTRACAAKNYRARDQANSRNACACTYVRTALSTRALTEPRQKQVAMSTGGYQVPSADFTPTGFGSDSPEVSSRNGAGFHGSSAAGPGIANPPLFEADYKRFATTPVANCAGSARSNTLA